MAAEPLLDHAHPPPVPHTSKEKVIGGPQEDEPHEEPDRRDHERIEQPGLLRHRHDVAVTHGRDGDHREVQNIGEADVAVDIVAQAGTIEPMARQCDPEQREDQPDPPQQRQPDRRAPSPSQRTGGGGVAACRAMVASYHAAPVRRPARRHRCGEVQRAGAGGRARSVMSGLPSRSSALAARPAQHACTPGKDAPTQGYRSHGSFGQDRCGIRRCGGVTVPRISRRAIRHASWPRVPSAFLPADVLSSRSRDDIGYGDQCG